jgi:maltose O-acetyltransferase
VVRYRRQVLKDVLGSVGEGCTFSFGIKILNPERVHVADGCRFANSTILGATGGISFGRNCLIGFENIFLTRSHRYDRCDIPVWDQGYRTAPIALGDDVWTGCRVIVLPGVTIGDHTIVGAGSVVSRDLPSGVIAAGAPARVVRERTSGDDAGRATGADGGPQAPPESETSRVSR